MSYENNWDAEQTCHQWQLRWIHAVLEKRNDPSHTTWIVVPSIVPCGQKPVDRSHSCRKRLGRLSCDSVSRSSLEGTSRGVILVRRADGGSTMALNGASTPINIPHIRYSELGSNSTRYERLIAAASNDEIFFMWLFWSILTGLVTIFSSTVFLGLLSDKRARVKPFNMYLIFLMVPDIFYGLMCFINCSMNLAVGHFYSEGWCLYQSFYTVWGIGRCCTRLACRGYSSFLTHLECSCACSASPFRQVPMPG